MFSEAKILSPASLNELDSYLAGQSDELTFIAGATDLMVNGQRWKGKDRLVDLSGVKEMSGTIEIQEQGILIGAAVSMSAIIKNKIISQFFPVLTQALRLIGSVQIQNRATLGGNIANASPAGDSLPALSVCDARLYVGPPQNGEFEITTIEKVMTGPGQTGLGKNRYIAFIFIPYLPRDNSWYFRKVGQREALAISKVSLAVVAGKKNGKLNEIRICAGAVTPRIIRAQQTENLLLNQVLDESLIEKARQQIMQEVSPIDDIRSGIKYRRRISGELLREALYRIKSG